MNEIGRYGDKFTDFDPIAEAERKIGKPYQEFSDEEAMVSLGIAIAYNGMKKSMYMTRKDNWFGAPLNVTTGIFVDFGFETVFMTEGCGRRMSDKLFVMHWQNKMLAIFDTYQGELNSGKVYALAMMDKPNWAAIPDRFSGGWSEEDRGMVVDYDIREGLKGLLIQLSSLNLKSFPWYDKPYITLLAPGESDFSGDWQSNPNHLDDYGKVSELARNKRLPIIAQKMGLDKLFEKN